MENLAELNAFLADERLSDLIERVKISDDTLDVISLSETQHSSMLAWCLTPGEGHGQGDSVLKDFLVTAYQEGEKTNKYANKKFFEKWPPGRICTSSFGSAFVAREFSIRTEESTRRRLDLFIIDLQNKIVVTIENKAGASLTADQLSDYYERVSNQVGSRPIFADFDFLYVVVDRELGLYEDEVLEKLGNRWALLDYEWLKQSAKRARLHLERGNQAAQLLMAYCEKQTGWQSKNQEKISLLSAELASSHESIVTMLGQWMNHGPTAWTPTDLTGAQSHMLAFAHQYRPLCEQLLQSRGIGAVLVGLRKNLPSVAADDFETGRTTLDFASAAMETLMADPEGYWPVYVNVYRDAQASGDDVSRFTLRLMWRHDHLIGGSAEERDSIRRHFAKRFEGLHKFTGRGNRQRRIVIGKKLTARQAIEQVIALVTEVDQLVRDGYRLQRSV